MASTTPNSSRIGGRRPLISRRVSSMARLISCAAESKPFHASDGVACERFAEGLQPEQGAGKLLGEAVVNVVGDQLAFALVKIQQSPQQSLLLLDALGGQPFLGDVGADDHGALDAVFAGQRHQPGTDHHEPKTSCTSKACGKPVAIACSRARRQAA